MKLCPCNSCSAIDKEYAAGKFVGRVASYFGVTEPLLEFLQRDDLAVAFFLFFSGSLAPRVELLVGDAPGLVVQSQIGY